MSQYVFKIMHESAKKNPHTAQEYAEKDHIEAAIKMCNRFSNAVVVRWDKRWHGLSNPKVVY